jgi:predicted Zn-dependent protease with MMP-like domain
MSLSDLRAPSLADMEAMAFEAYARLPEPFRRASEGVAIRVEDFPTDEVLEEMELESPFDLLGLYTGVAITRASVTDAPREPNMVFLYRRPLLDYWAEHEETLGDLVVHVLIHEIGHHMGLSDDDIDAIEASVKG